MTCALVLVLACLPLAAAGIRGTVVENQTGRALSRATVVLQPVPGTPGVVQSVRTTVYGGFEFSNLPAGTYVLKASRPGFIAAEYGQKRWNSAGTPLTIAKDDSPFLSIRLPRYGAITGTVLDENDVGIPQQQVIAYRATQPPQLAGRASSDDRGVYRLSGLMPGNYFVRTFGALEDGVQYLPTFSKQTARVEEARPVQVFVDEDAPDADVRPMVGKLFTLDGVAVPAPENVGPVRITLSSDMGRQTAVGPAFRFMSLPPGRYELYAEVAGSNPQAAFVALNVNQDEKLGVSLQPIRESRFEITGGVPGTELLARRKDLAASQDSPVLKVVNDRAMLGPGRWEFRANPPAGHYVASFSGPTKSRPDGWNETMVSGSAIVRFALSGGASSLHGVVNSSGEIVAGVPVYLEAYDPDTRLRLLELVETRTDTRGAYRFESIAPGTYRVLATFEYRNPDTSALEAANARVLRFEPQSSLQVDLDLYLLR